jgi:hypothetical protein
MYSFLYIKNNIILHLKCRRKMLIVDNAERGDQSTGNQATVTEDPDPGAANDKSHPDPSINSYEADPDPGAAKDISHPDSGTNSQVVDPDPGAANHDLGVANKASDNYKSGDIVQKTSESEMMNNVKEEEKKQKKVEMKEEADKEKEEEKEEDEDRKDEERESLTKKEKIKFDDILKDLGDFGHYQKIIYFFLFLPTIFRQK